MSIGVSAAVVRINREEKEKGRSTQQSLESLKRRWGILFDQKTEGLPGKEGLGGKSG